MKKRWIAILICAAMYLVPAAAFAQEPAEPENPQQLRDAVEQLVMSGAQLEVGEEGEPAAPEEETAALETENQTDGAGEIQQEEAPPIEPAAAGEQELLPAMEGQESEGIAAVAANTNRDQESTFNFEDYDFSDPSAQGLAHFPTDEEFFGVWNKAQGQYTTQPILDYGYVSPYHLNLGAVEAAVQEGDYETAKVELQKYYNEKLAIRGHAILGNNGRQEILTAQLLLQNFHYNGNSNHNVADIFYMGGDWAPVYVEMKDQVERFVNRGGDGKMPITICGVNKDDYEAVFYSKENKDAGPNVQGKSAYLEVQVGSTLRRIPVSEDTYTAAGDYRKQAFGSESWLYAREAAIGETDPVNSDTRRTFLKFDLSSIKKGDPISSARLVMYGRWEDKQSPARGDKNYQKRMVAITNYDTGWTENELFFNDTSHTNAIFSYDGEWGTKWVQPNKDRCNPLSRFEEELFRMSTWFDKLCAQYQRTHNEVYAQTAFMFLHDWIMKTYNRYRGCSEVPDPKGDGNSSKLIYGGYSKGLDLHTRSANLPRLIEYLYDSEYMTPDLFTTFVKYMYSMGKVHSGYWTNQESGNNWGTASCNGFFQIIGYYPEFRQSEEWSQIMLNRLEEITGHVLFDDGSCVELAHGYTQYTITTLMSTKDTADKLGVEVKYTDSIKEKIVKLARYLMFSSAPGWRDNQEGDSHTFSTSYKNDLKRVADWLQDPQLLWAAYDKKKGVAPDFTSTIYPDGKKVYMRSGWGADDLYLATSADASAGSHGHWDDNNVVVAAYGTYLLADPLYYMLSGGSDLTCRWLFSSRAHNTMQINDYCQKAAKSVYDPTLPLGGTMGDIAAWETNGGYDFNKMHSDNYKNIAYRGAPQRLPAVGNETPPVEPGMDFERNILFIKPNFWIVSDYMDPVDKSKVNKYTQLWHMDPGANMSVDGQYQLKKGEKIGDVDAGEVDSVIENTQFVPGTGNGTIRSNFGGSSANIMVVPADISSVEPKLYRGLYSYGTGSQQRTPYGLFEKNVQGTTTMDTILFPQKSTQDFAVSSTPQQTGLPQGAASALRATVKDNSGSSNENYAFDYYLLHEQDKKKEVTVGNTGTDGELAYYEKDLNTGLPRRMMLREGTYVKDIEEEMYAVKGAQNIDELSVTWENDVLKLDLSREMIPALSLQNMYIYSPVPISKVMLRDTEVPFYYADSYVYFDAANPPEGGKPPVDNGGSISPGTPSMPHGNGSGGGGSSAPGPGVTPGPGTTDPVGPPVPPEVLLKQELTGHWAEKEISSLIDRGIVKGSNGTLDLAGDVSRAEFTAMIVRALGIQPAVYNGGIADVPQDAWYAGELKAAVDQGIIQGDSAGVRPDDPVTREEMAKIILAAYQSAGGQLAQGEQTQFSDTGQISSWAKEAVEQASRLGLIRGFETGEFRPQENAQREQAMVMIYRLLEGTEKKEE